MMRRLVFLFLLFPFILLSETVIDNHDANVMTTHNQCAVVAGGIIGNCTEYDGTSDWMECPDNNNLDITGDFSIQAWVEDDDGAGIRYIIMKKTDDGQADGTMNYGIFLNTDDEVTLRIGGTVFHSTNTVGMVAWNHIVVTVDIVAGDEEVIFYVDNVSDNPGDEGDKTPVANAHELIIGKHTDAGANDDSEWTGELDEIAIWSRVLSPADVANLFNGGAGLAYGALGAGLKTNLISYWKAPSTQVIIMQTE